MWLRYYISRYARRPGTSIINASLIDRWNQVLPITVKTGRATAPQQIGHFERCAAVQCAAANFLSVCLSSRRELKQPADEQFYSEDWWGSASMCEV